MEEEATGHFQLILWGPHKPSCNFTAQEDLGASLKHLLHVHCQPGISMGTKESPLKAQLLVDPTTEEGHSDMWQHYHNKKRDWDLAMVSFLASSFGKPKHPIGNLKRLLGDGEKNLNPQPCQLGSGCSHEVQVPTHQDPPYFSYQEPRHNGG